MYFYSGRLIYFCHGVDLEADAYRNSPPFWSARAGEGELFDVAQVNGFFLRVRGVNTYRNRQR